MDAAGLQLEKPLVLPSSGAQHVDAGIKEETSDRFDLRLNSADGSTRDSGSSRLHLAGGVGGMGGALAGGGGAAAPKASSSSAKRSK